MGIYLGKKSISWVVVLLCVTAAMASGAPFSTTVTRTTCPTPTSVGAFAATDACETGTMDSWLVFSNFVNSQSANGLMIQSLANAANQGFYFPQSVTGPANFQIGFNIQAVNELLEGLTFHVTASSGYQNQSSVTMYVCPGQTVGCDPNNAVAMTLGTASAMPYDTLSFNSTANLGVLFVGNVDAGAMLSQFEVTAVTGVPEPATLGMMGLAFVLLGAGVRRKA